MNDHECCFCRSPADPTNFASDTDDFESASGDEGPGYPLPLPDDCMDASLYCGAHHDAMWVAHYPNPAGYGLSHMPHPVFTSDWLALQLQHFDECLQKVPDQRRGRESRALKILS